MSELLKAAEADYRLIKIIWNDIGDEGIMQQAMYHMQQAIEKLLKCLIMLGGTRFTYTHDIGKLIEQCPKDVELPEGLEEMAPLLTSWESTTRYGTSVCTNIKTLEKCVAIYDALHTTLLRYTEDKSRTVYTIETFIMDNDTCEAVKAIHGTGYLIWFHVNFPKGAASAKEVLDKLKEE